MPKMRLFVLLLALVSSSVLARQGDDLNALNLADTATKPVVKASDWHAFVEAAFGQSRLSTGSNIANQRLSIDLQYDTSFAHGWRVVLSDRLDLLRQDKYLAQPTYHKEINTLREAYLSWQLHDNQIIDLGRINAYQGVASGYNPTDFFRTGAVRSMISVDPASLKKNRQGSVMLRAQHLWDSGSLTALVSPKLEAQANGASFSPDFGATNNQTRYLIAFSQKVRDGITPQWLLYAQEHQAPQLGLNISVLPSDAIVAYLEYAGGRTRTQLAQVLNDQRDRVWRNRLATGLTYTTSDKLSLSIEYEFNGSAPDNANWNTLRSGSPFIYGRYRSAQQNAQELTTRRELFVYASWQDAGLIHLDLSAMKKNNLDDQSHLMWLEARYHFDKIDLALQWQKNSGDPSSTYGAAPQKNAWQAVLRSYF